MFRGRVQLGDEVILGIQCYDSSGNPVAPDAAPTLSIYDSSGSAVLKDKTFPPRDQQNATGLFEHFVRLGADYSTGFYSVFYKWSSSAFNGRESDWFEIMEGGPREGAVIAMHFFETPGADFLVQQLDSGQIKRGKNPKI